MQPSQSSSYFHSSDVVDYADDKYLPNSSNNPNLLDLIICNTRRLKVGKKRIKFLILGGKNEYWYKKWI